MSRASKFGIYGVLLLFFTGCLNHSRYSALEPVYKINSPKPHYANNGQVEHSKKKSRPSHYLVKPGDTLYSIAFRYGLDYKKLAYANNIDKQFRIYEGQTLVLKEGQAPKVTSSAAAEDNTKSTTKTSPPQSSVSSKDTVSQKIDGTKSAKKTTSKAVILWRWPHNGKIVRTYSASSSGNKGIDLQGRIGDSVLAAANGVVVYAGNGLPGYGNLIILEHSNGLLSAYAFNQKILVEEKGRVSSGQKIATMGKLGDQPGLHFEIRQNGKPINPLKYLPER